MPGPSRGVIRPAIAQAPRSHHKTIFRCSFFNGGQMVRDMRCRTPKKDDKVWLTPPENPPVCEVPLRDEAYIRVKCPGRDLYALVDTGASKCLMSMDIYQSLVGRPKLTTSDIPHFRVANNGMLPTCSVTTLPLCIGDQEMAVKLCGSSFVKWNNTGPWPS